MKIRAILRLKNEAMLSRREKLWLSQVALAELADVSPQFVSRLECLDFSDFKDASSPAHEKLQRVAMVLELQPEEIAPPEVMGTSIPKRFTSVQDCDPLRLASCAMRDHALGYKDHVLLKETMDSVMSTLSRREREVISARYGLNEDGATYTLEECGRHLKITRSRVAQIESSGLRKLQHPFRSRKLERWAESSMNDHACSLVYPHGDPRGHKAPGMKRVEGMKRPT